MPDTAGGPQIESGLQMLIDRQFALTGFVPLPDRIAAIASYLDEVRAAAVLLPELDPIRDPLDVTFDPSWTGDRS